VNDERIQEVVPDVFVGIPYPYDGAMCVVVGSETTLIMDGTSYQDFAKEFVDEVESRTRVQRRLCALTHRHFDHWAGLAAFDESIIAPRETREILDTYDQEWLTTNTTQWIDAGMLETEWLGTPRVRLPDILFDNQVSIDLGGLTVELIHIGGHVTDIAVAWIPERGVLFAADAIGNGRDLYLDESDGPSWIAALERISALPITTVVPGHGPVGDRSLIDAQLESLRTADHDAPRRSA
jgi:glyoxylase-like metal-dependent hydrolase (beta-lactamase superfamily II)